LKRGGCVQYGHGASSLLHQNYAMPYRNPGEGVWIKGRRHGWLQT
jgi:hypothetical protein